MIFPVVKTKSWYFRAEAVSVAVFQDIKGEEKWTQLVVSCAWVRDSCGEIKNQKARFTHKQGASAKKHPASYACSAVVDKTTTWLR